MKNIILLLACVTLWASPAPAQQPAPPPPPAAALEVFEVDFFPGYRWVRQKGDARPGEYEYLKSSAAGEAIVEWDPLPQRFLLETYILNKNDYYGEFDYAYRDVVLLNVTSRKLYHNLDHYFLGADDPATATPSFTDSAPQDDYFSTNATNRFFVRLKTPDFPFHLYAEGRVLDNSVTMQQRFMQAFSGGFNKASRTRSVDWETEEAKVGFNSHLGPVEIDYSHVTKKFETTGDKVLTDPLGAPSGAFFHNLSPDFESSADTVKIHTSHTGRIAAAATWSEGEKENRDSAFKQTFVNAAGDLTLIPWKDLTMTFRYRHYDVNVDTPDRVTTATPAGTATYDVRNGVISQRDTVSGAFRVRLTDRMTVRGEYAWESLLRNIWPGYDTFSSPPNSPAFWTLDERITKGTAKLGAAYRLGARLTFRADASRQNVEVPDNSVDNTYPETTDAATASLTWSPAQWLNMLLSGGTVIEERDKLAAPLAGSRKSQRDRALGSFTVFAGKKAAVTTSYAYFQNRISAPIAWSDASGAVTAEMDVPYADSVHTATLAATYAMDDALTFTAEASQSHARGGFRVSETVPGTAGIPQLTNLKEVDTVLGAGLEVRTTQHLGYDLRYRYRKLDDRLDDTRDGTMHIALAMLTLRW